MCYGNLNNKMKFIQRYKSPKFIGIGDKVRYQNNIYDVLVNYIVGETDRHGYTCLLYTSPSPRDRTRSRMPSSA